MIVTLQEPADVRAAATGRVGRATWDRDADWEELHAGLEAPLRFITGVAGGMSRAVPIRTWLLTGQHRLGRSGLYFKKVLLEKLQIEKKNSRPLGFLFSAAPLVGCVIFGSLSLGAPWVIFGGRGRRDAIRSWAA